MSPTKRTAQLLKAFHYQQILENLEQLYLKGHNIDQFEQDLEQIKTAQTWCAQHADKDEAAAGLCSTFARIAGHLCEAKLPRLEYIDWMESGLAAAKRFDLKVDQLAHLIHLSGAHFLNNNPDKAFILCEQALSLSRDHLNHDGEATILSNLGAFYMSSGKVELAINNLQKALEIYQNLSDLGGQGSVLSTLGSCYSNLQKYDQAIEYFNQALNCFDQTQNFSGKGNVLANRSSDLIYLGKFKEARESLEQARIIAESLENESLGGTVLAHFAMLSMREEDATRRSNAIEELKNALQAFRRDGNKLQEFNMLSVLESIYRSVLSDETYSEPYKQRSQALLELGNIHRFREEYTEAVEHYQQLLEVAQKAENISDEFLALFYLGHCYVLLKRHREAIKFHEQALVKLADLPQNEEGNEVLRQECELNLSLGQGYRHSSRPKEAKKCYQRALKISQTILDAETERRARGNLGLIYTDLGRYDEALFELEQTLKLLEKIGDYRLMAHARFNIGYAYHQKGDNVTAKKYGEKALQVLEQINDSTVSEVRRQMETWGN